MTRIRTIKPDFFRHLDLFKAEKETGLPLRAAYPGLWCVADREGRFKWQPEVLKLDVLPFDDLDFSRVLDALTTRGFIVKYEVKGKFYGVIPSFKEHQMINNREKDSALPGPIENTMGQTENIIIQDGLTRGSRVDDVCGTPLDSAQVEGEGEGEEEREGDISVLADTRCASGSESENGKKCPYEKIVSLYHEICLSMPKAESWNGTGRKMMGQRWREDRARQSLEWWTKYFNRVMESDFLTGRVKDFTANLTWLVGPTNMDKVLNGAYDNRRSGGVPERLRNNIQAGVEFLEG